MFPSDNDFESKFTFETEADPVAEEPPFHLLMLGDWSGDASRSALNQRRPLVIDRDNFDDVLKRLDVKLDLDFQDNGSNVLSIKFSELDDFHPDNLFRRLDVFQDLRDLRRRLLDADTFEQAAGQVRSWFHSPDESEKDRISAPDAVPRDLAPAGLLDAILSRSEGSVSAGSKTVDNTELGQLISKVVSPFLIRIDENEQSQLVAAVDQATSDLMRSILHHEKFQGLESAWRGLYFLLRKIETDIDLKVFIFDLSKNELAEDLQTPDNLTGSNLYRWLIRETLETPGGEPWAAVCGNYTFGLNVVDIAALMRLAKLSEAANAPFISYLRPELLGVKSFAEYARSSGLKFTENSKQYKLWSTLRDQEESNYLGLSPMRFLSRMPYGELSDPTEVFSFEEIAGSLRFPQYLWSNPCFVIAFLLANSYRRYGWEMGQSLERDLEGLPLHLYQEDGETKIQPCAEVVLTENEADIILNLGLMPLLTFRDTDRVRLARFQSAADPLSNLQGRWTD
jgi:type VI secretion system protein ImpC